MKCSNCGNDVNEGTKFCNNCGAAITVEEKKPETVKVEKKKSPVAAIIICIAIAIVLAIASAAVTGIVVKKIDQSTMKTGKMTLSELESKLDNAKKELADTEQRLNEVKAQVEAQEKKIKPLKDIYNKSLAPGDYKVGADLEPGIYHFKYKLKKKDAWGGDYIYVTHAGSKGSNKTLGGTKYDLRVQGSDDGESVSIKLQAGDKVFVNNDLGGSFEPAKK